MTKADMRAQIKQVEEHLLGTMRDGTYVAGDVTFTAQEIREVLWALYDTCSNPNDD